MFSMTPTIVRMPEGVAPTAPRHDTGTWAAARDASADLLGSRLGAPNVVLSDGATAEAEALAALLVAYHCVPPGPNDTGPNDRGASPKAPPPL
jgi:hypothetical protein